MGEKMKELKTKDAMKAASKIWKTLEESEKEEYKSLLNKKDWYFTMGDTLEIF